MELSLAERLSFALPTLLALSALASGVTLLIRGKHRRLGCGFLAAFSLVIAGMGGPCVRQLLDRGHVTDLPYCAPGVVVSFNPYFSLGWLLRSLGRNGS